MPCFCMTLNMRAQYSSLVCREWKEAPGWRLGHPLKVVRCFACQIQEVFLDDSLTP
jgi:hypothetical protein